MLRVTTQITGISGAPYYSTMYSEGSALVEAQSFVVAVHSFWTSWSGVMATELQIQVQPEVDIVDPATGLTTGQWVYASAPIDCTGASDQLPNATQALVRWDTGVFVAGRKLRGRTFIPGMIMGNNEDGKPNAASAAIWKGWCDTLLASSDFGIYSPTHHVFNLGASASIWSEWAILRSRRD